MQWHLFTVCFLETLKIVEREFGAEFKPYLPIGWWNFNCLASLFAPRIKNMASSTTIPNVRDPDSSTDGTAKDFRHSPHNKPFTSQTWAELAKKQERYKYNVTPNLTLDDQYNLNMYLRRTLRSSRPRNLTL